VSATNFNSAGWVPVELDSNVVQNIATASAVEGKARKEPMATLSKLIPRSAGTTASFIARSTSPTEDALSADTITLTAHKVLNTVRIAEEDLEDSLPDIIGAKTVGWANAYARLIDNATLATTAAATGDTVPFTSAYKYVRSNDTDLSYVADTNYTASATSGGITYANLNTALGKYEQSLYFDASNTLVIISPSVLQTLRGLVDSQGRPIFLDAPVSGASPTLFGYPVVVSQGVRTSAVATSTPSGNGLVIFANMDYLVLGNRTAGPEVRVIPANLSTSDEAVVQFRIRKGFAVTAPGVSVLEALS